MGDTETSPPPPKQRRLVRWYKNTALFTFNLLVVFIIVNVLTWAGIAIRSRALKRVNPVLQKYSADALRQVYPGMSEDEWNQMLIENWKEVPFGFEQFTQFKELEYHGKFVNQSKFGFRETPNQGPWPLEANNYNVFMLGGSTMWGLGVADNQTITAYLQPLMQSTNKKRVCLYNFGRAAYFSSVERILFEQLLLNGARPDVCIFIDGLNDFRVPDDDFANTRQLTKLMQPTNARLVAAHAGAILMVLPVGKVIGFAAARLHPDNSGDLLPLIPKALDRYLWNKQAIEAVAKQQGIPTVFVFQPVPVYGYDLELHLFAAGLENEKLVTAGYQLMADYQKQHVMGDDFLWLGDAQKGITKPLYCDVFHYSPAGHELIASEIHKFLQIRKLKPATQP